jgi:hypothetical protein
MIPFLLEDLRFDGKKSAAMRFALLNELGYEKIDTLIETALNDETSAEVFVEAVKALGNDIANEQKLLDVLSHKKQDVRETALYALIKVKSEQGTTKMLEVLRSKKYKAALKAVCACTDESVIRQIAKILENAVTEIQQLDTKSKEYTSKHEFVVDLTEAVYQLNPEPFFSAYKELFTNIGQIKQIYNHLSNYPNDVVFSFMKTLIAQNNFHQEVEMWTFIRTFYKVSVHHWNTKELYDFFSPYYEGKQFWKSALDLYYTTQKGETKIDDRWGDLFIKRNDYDLLAEVISYNNAVSEETSDKIWRHLIDESRKFAEGANFKANYSEFSQMVKCVTLDKPERTDALKEIAFTYLTNMATGKETTCYVNAFDAMKKRSDVFGDEKFVQKLEKLLADNPEHGHKSETAKLYNTLKGEVT